MFLEPKTNLHPRIGLIGLILLAGLCACSNPDSRTPGGDPNKTSTVEGTLGTGLETDIELFAKPGLRIQASGESDNVLTGTYVVAINAIGQVLASSGIDAKGKFSLTANRGQAIALALASKGPSGKWLCQQTLQYQNPTDAQAAAKIAVLDLATASINAGNFSWKASNGRPTSAPAPSVANPSATDSSRFVDESLNGFMRCGNTDALETVVRADFDLKFSNDLPINDPARTYTNSFMFGLDTSGPHPRFKGSAHIEEDGSLEMRVRYEAGQALKLAPVITDDRPVTVGIALMPTWNLGLNASDVVQEPQLGKLTGEIVLAKGEVQADDGSAVSGARLNWAQVNDTPNSTSQIALGRGISGLFNDTGSKNSAGAFRLLVPKRSKPDTETYRMNITDPVSLERTDIDVSVTADATGSFAGFSRGGNALASGSIKLEKPKARRVVVDVSFVPSGNNADVSVTYLTGTGPTPFQTITPLLFTAFESGAQTVLNMNFSSLETSQKNTDFVFAQVGAGSLGLTETPTNVGAVTLAQCVSLDGCTSSTLTNNEFAQSIKANASNLVQANATRIGQQVSNAGTELTGVAPLSQDSFPVIANSFLGIDSTSLPIQIRWPSVNTTGRSLVRFQLNFLTVAR